MKAEAKTDDTGVIVLDVSPYTYGGGIRVPLSPLEAQVLLSQLTEELRKRTQVEEWYAVTSVGTFGPTTQARVGALCSGLPNDGVLATVVHESEVRP